MGCKSVQGCTKGAQVVTPGDGMVGGWFGCGPMRKIDLESIRKCVVGTQMVHQPTEERPLGLVCTYAGISWIGTMEQSGHACVHADWARPEAVSEYDPAYRTLRFSNASPMHLRSSSMYSDALCIGLHMLHNSAPPPASAPPHVPPPLVCLFVSPSRLPPLIDGQWTSTKSDCTCSIRRGLGRRLRSSLLLNSSPSTSRDHPLVA